MVTEENMGMDMKIKIINNKTHLSYSYTKR